MMSDFYNQIAIAICYWVGFAVAVCAGIALVIMIVRYEMEKIIDMRVGLVHVNKYLTRQKEFEDWMKKNAQ